MAETPLKRQRAETQVEETEENKRHKSYNHILSLLEQEEDEPTQDLSFLVTSLQQELHPVSSTTEETDQENSSATIIPTIEDYPSSSSSSSSRFLKGLEDDKDRVIRHLLEASDDELGIPNTVVGTDFDEGFNRDLNGFSLCDSLWEIEDANANYYALLQSELFM